MSNSAPPTGAVGTPADLTNVRVDGCPNCVANTEEAFDACATTRGYVATYKCSDCGHRWSTAWSDA